MKKIYKIFSIFIFSFILFSSVFSFASADTFWSFTETTPLPGVAHSGYKSQTECQNEFDAYVKAKPYLSAPTACTSYEASLPVTTLPTTPVNISADKITKDSSTGTYKLLAPIGTMETIQTTDLGKYINTMIQIIIGLCAALAVVYIIIGGIQWMGNESVFGKTQAKERIGGAILGLIIAVGSYALLNTINPDLLGKNGLSIAQVSIEIIDKPDAGDMTVDPDFKKQTGTYLTTTISPGVQNTVDKLKQGMSIDSFNINTGSKKMVIKIKNGSLLENSSPIDINIGMGGVSEVGQGVTGDKKTPKGTWKILEIRTSKDKKPVFNKTGSNMGASFWLLSPTNNGDRGIGMHGDKSGTTQNSTIGCIKLKNSDIVSLLPYIKSGIPVIIQ